MGAVIVQGQGIANAAAGKGQACLAHHEGMIFRTANAQGMVRATQQARCQKSGHIGWRHRAISDPSLRGLDLNHGLQPGHAARAGANDLHTLACLLRQGLSHAVSTDGEGGDILGYKEADHGWVSSATASIRLIPSRRPWG